MKTNFLKEILQKAIQIAPENFALSEVRMHLKFALSKLEQLEQKNKNSNMDSNSNNWVLSNGVLMHPLEAKKALQTIDKLIDIEKNKIEEINKNKESKDDNEIQTFFG